MLVSLNWLADYVDLTDQQPAELAEKITRSGIEVDAIEVRSQDMKNVVIGHVVSKEKHPEADKLNICQVDVGTGELSQIVCGAPNVDAGQNVIVAVPGARLPGGFKIKKAKLRGQESNGMICSLQELGIEGKVVPKAFADGIFVLPADAPVGQDALEYLSLHDTVLELGLTPNRADAMSMLGVAYEVAAILQQSVKLPEITYASATETAQDALTLRVDALDANPLYIAKVIKDIKVGPSPQWLQNRLMAVGVRPHNNVVDVTNYVLMEYGQPLHAFDYDRLATKEIVVRMATEGEVITTLDDQERKLEATDLVITNGQEPVAVAGVMGGANSEVHDGTTTVVLESAYFTGSFIRQTSKRLGLRSDASARFEKGVDPNRVEAAAERAAQLLAELAGGTVLAGSVVVDELDKTPKKVVVSPDFINERLGMKISFDEMQHILTRLQFPFEVANGLFYIDAPTRRQDIVIPEDIVEEIARMYGYDRIPMTLPEGAHQAGGLTPYQAKRRLVRQTLEGAGLYQAVTYSLTSSEQAQRFALHEAPVTKLLMPMSEERSTLRQSLIPHLVEAASYNVARRVESVALYEVGSVFLDQGMDELPVEIEHVAGVVTGLWVDNAWQGEKKPVDFFVVKGIVEALAAKLGATLSYRQAKRDGLHPGRTADILFGEIVVGFIGQLHPTEQKRLDLKETYVFELNMQALITEVLPTISYTAVSRFPAITRDIALVVDRETPAETLESVIRASGGKLVTAIRLFDLYQGDKMAADKKSVAFSITYQDPERTLTDEEVVAAHEKVVAALAEQAGAELRG
ncbi:phenylalanine--tRNA ligase subunit beta [Chryseomicrobium excrementi]|uniref:Phenylalanine--tRNA ligase beta subunit n=1 Tax=Chryseomicrobium excrementi TaxID=2041346 RepID=A0A2M9F1T3_9BACL|nr:phenylalanine--tRNA ligase subunit beta [Chryseomicrobium excrementi]PJK17427.1 phenylalanine--tRNA ligase subunit beta [Chryseomicrobium excrementi]